MYPGTHSAQAPERVAATLVDTGESVTYGELEERSTRLARVLHEAGLRPGDCVALVTENNLRAFEVYWAAMRSGLYITAVNHHLTTDEVVYIVEDSGAAALLVSAEKSELANAVAERTEGAKVKLAFGGRVPGFDSYEAALAEASSVPFKDQPHGATMLYSSGTTGRPKGVRPPLPGVQVHEQGDPITALVGRAFGVGPDTVYLTPAPIYHAAPLRWAGAVQAHGGTVVVLKRFDAAASLRAIEQFRVTHAQFVPTMMLRMLQLPETVRKSYDLSSLKVAIHAAAPCPVDVKHKMIDWWGPILMEYYSGTEGNGTTLIDSKTWLTKPGSVGKAVLGTLHICNEEGEELPPGEIGTVYVERETVPFVYHNDPEKTKAAQHPRNETWTTMGDIGYLDADGFLFLTDRKAYVIISGGVNIYPQEIEDVLVLHPDVYDVGVIGVPDEEMGESVKAFIQPKAAVASVSEFENEIIAFVKSKIASFKAPRSVELIEEMPRTLSGKLLKGKLKARHVEKTS